MLEQVRETSSELVLLSLAAIAGLALVLALTWLGVLPDPEVEPWSAIVAGPLLIGTAGLAYWGLARLRDEPPDQPLQARTGQPAGLLMGLSITVAGMVIAATGSMLLGLLQAALFGSEVEEQQAIVSLVERGDPFELVLLAVAAVILAPLTEELLFRHMLFRRLIQRAGPTVAFTLPAVAFALAHYNPVGLVIYVWLGSVFAMAYLWSGRLWVAILVHAGHNAFALALLLYAPEALP